MKMTRKSRFSAALFALFSVLFMQFAVASYACPMMVSGTTESVMTAMPGCNGLDVEKPNLCLSHCQSSEQSLDKPEVPVFPAAAPVPVLSSSIDLLSLGQPALERSQPTLARANSPPLAIRNCCFRI